MGKMFLNIIYFVNKIEKLSKKDFPWNWYSSSHFTSFFIHLSRNLADSVFVMVLDGGSDTNALRY